ncbi:membrane protein insertase YidC [Candidatus Acetothermia bacterium]|nr:membrane protein insertase YidC [Candidatus Acetothermia bacterium]
MRWLPLKTFACLLCFSLLYIDPVGLSQVASTSYKIESQTLDEQGVTHIQVKNALINYDFSTVGGTLQSAYLYFAPWGSSREEMIPGTTTDQKSLKRTYTPGQVYPFQLSLGLLKPTDVYQSRIIPSADGSQLQVEFTHEADGLKVTKLYTIHNDATGTIDFALTLQNLSPSGKKFDDGYKLALGTGVHKMDEKAEARFFFDGQRTSAIVQNGKLEGLGFVSGFALWLITQPTDSLKPYQEPLQLNVSTQQGILQVSKTALGVQSAPITLAPSQTMIHNFRLYTGRVKYTLLELVKLQHIADMSWWDQLLVPVANFLNWLFGFTGNYAWAILLFTLLTRILLFPLTRAQYHSMAKMTQLQPRLQKLQQRYPNLNQLKASYPKMSELELKQRAMENRQEMTQKMMEMYKKEGVNPLGGCLPMVIQFPILIVLWQAITYTAEQIHLTPGFLWLPDLSLADPLYIIVLLTVAAMIVQTKMTPTPGAQQNQLLTWVMPIMMGVMLKDFASGLWIYYFSSTVAQVGQQMFISWELKREAARKPAPALAEDDDALTNKPVAQEAQVSDGNRSQN